MSRTQSMLRQLNGGFRLDAVTTPLSGAKLCALFGVQPEWEPPLRKPVAMPARSAIRFCNAQSPAIEDAAGSLHNRRFVHNGCLQETDRISVEPERRSMGFW